MKFPIGNKQQTKYKHNKITTKATVISFSFISKQKFQKSGISLRRTLVNWYKAWKSIKRRTEIFVPLISTLERFHREFPTQLRIFLHYFFILLHSFVHQGRRKRIFTYTGSLSCSVRACEDVLGGCKLGSIMRLFYYLLHVL